MNEPGLVEDLLSSARTIAVVGYSPRPDRPSNSVSAYLRANGYRIVPVNPRFSLGLVDGEHCYERLADIPPEVLIDFADVFRRGEFLDAVVDDAVAARIPAIWFQLDLGNEDAARRAEAAGMRVVWDRCTAIEHRRVASRLRRE